MRIDGAVFEPQNFDPNVYTAQSGDTLNSVASMFQVSPEMLAQYNRLSMDAQLFAGLQLLIPTVQQADAVQSAQGIGGAFDTDTLHPPVLTGPSAVGATPGSSYDIFNQADYDHHLKQTGERACGTTSLAMILQHYGINQTPDQIDHEIRRTNVGVAPERLVDYTREQGLECEQYNNSNWDELKGFLDKGIPCMVQIDPDSPGNFNTHYVDVTGYGTNPDGSEYVMVSDPSADSGPTKMPMDEFKAKWGHIHIADTENGYNNFFIAIAPKGTDLPSSRVDSNVDASALDTAKSDITNGWDRMTDPDNVGDEFQGAGEIVGSLGGFVGGGVGFGVWKLGSWFNDWTEGIPVVQNLVQPIGDIFQGVGEGLGDLGNMWDNAWVDIGNAAGNCVNHWGDAFGDLFDGDVGGFFENAGSSFVDLGKGAVDVVGDVASGVADTVVDVGSSAVDAVGDFFSGW